MALLKVEEFPAFSLISWDDATEQAIRKARRSRSNIRSIYIRNQIMDKVNGQIQYKVNAKVTYEV